jgi:hypothetical protein
VCFVVLHSLQDYLRTGTRDLEETKKQEPHDIVHMYADSDKADDSSDAQDSDQRLRWEGFLNLADGQKLGEDVLQAMELVDETREETKEQTTQVDKIYTKRLYESLADQIEAGKR